MTVIAWDGKTLAADKRATKYGLIYTVTKIFRVGDRLIGISGDATRGSELVHWIKCGLDLATYPQLQDKDNRAHIVSIERNGRIKLYESTAHPYVVEDQRWAEGEGRDFALAAMHLGMNAREAVEFTCRFISCCGNGVDTLTFDES